MVWLYGEDGDGISRWVSVIGPEEQKVEKNSDLGSRRNLYLYVIDIKTEKKINPLTKRKPILF